MRIPGGSVARSGRASAQPLLQLFSGYHGSTSAWNTTSGTFADPTSIGTTGFATSIDVGGLSVSTAAGDLPGITFTPKSIDAIYRITARVSLTSSSGLNAVSGCKLTDGTVDISLGGDIENTGNSTTGLTIPVTLEGFYQPGTVSPVTVKIQLYSNFTATIVSASSGVAIEWTIESLN